MSAFECPALLDLSTPRLYRGNAFRLLGLPVDAGVRDISRQTDRLLKMVEFSGGDGLQQTHALALQPPPTSDELREATQSLKEPEQRLINEFFWFWPTTPKSADDTAIQAILRGDAGTALAQWSELEEARTGQASAARHNIAVLLHLQALDASLQDIDHGIDAQREQKMLQDWRDAFDRWETLVPDPHVWDRVRDRITVLEDPRLSTSFARRMEAVLPLAFDKINAELAMEYHRRGNDRLARWHVAFLRSTHAGMDDASRIAHVVLKPSRDRVKRAINAATRTSNTAPLQGVAAVTQMLAECEPLVRLFDLFHDDGQHQRTELFDDVASAGDHILCSYLKQCRDNDAFIAGEQRLLALATSPELRRQIQDNIDFARGEIIFDPLYVSLRTIRQTKGSTAKRYRLFQREVLPGLPLLLTKAGVDSPASDHARDACAVFLRCLFLEENKPRRTLAWLQIAQDLAVDPQLKRSLEAEAQTIANGFGSGTCQICSARAAVPGNKLKHEMHKIVERTTDIQKLSSRVSYRPATLHVPRCRTCARQQETHWHYAAIAAVIGAIVAPAFGPFAAASGVAGLIFLLGLRIVFSCKKPAEDIGVAIFGLVVILGALASFKGSSQHPGAEFLIPQIVGGSLVLAIIGYHIGLWRRPKAAVVLKNHPRYRLLLADGYHDGLKPPASE